MTDVRKIPSSTLAFVLGDMLNDVRLGRRIDANEANRIVDEIETRLGVVDNPQWSCPVCGRMYRPEVNDA